MSSSMLRAIQRHRELQQDNMRELKRTKVIAAHWNTLCGADSVLTDKRQTRA